MSRTQVQLWYNQFKEAYEYINHDARPGRPSTSTTAENIEAATKTILDNRRVAIKEVADDGISFDSYIHTYIIGPYNSSVRISA